VKSHTKFGPDRFKRFDVYWIQTNKQTNTHPDKQTDKPNLYIEVVSKRTLSIIIHFTVYILIRNRLLTHVPCTLYNAQCKRSRNKLSQIILCTGGS